MSDLLSVVSRNTLVAVVSVLLAIPAVAATREETRVADAADVLDQLLRIPERSIPPALLSNAYAIAVVPNVVKVGFGIGQEILEEWELLAATENRSATYLIDFRIFMIERIITLSPSATGTHATWVETARLDSPLMRWLKLMPMDDKLDHMRIALESLDEAAIAAADTKEP